jgi:hypothetical protein
MSKDSDEGLTKEDRLVRKIISDDYEFEQHISPFEIINHFSKYQQSLEKFDISPEDFFEKLSIKNKEAEEFNDSAMIL